MNQPPTHGETSNRNSARRGSKWRSDNTDGIIHVIVVTTATVMSYEYANDSTNDKVVRMLEIVVVRVVLLLSM